MIVNPPRLCLECLELYDRTAVIGDSERTLGCEDLHSFLLTSVVTLGFSNNDTIETRKYTCDHP